VKTRSWRNSYDFIAQNPGCTPQVVFQALCYGYGDYHILRELQKSELITKIRTTKNLFGKIRLYTAKAVQMEEMYTVYNYDN
jgi:hypothetical protein